MSASQQIEDDARQRRPGGRTADVTRRINAAILELLIEGGVEACSFSNVAQRAGIERSTLYRRSPDRWQAIVDAVIDLADRLTPAPETQSFREDLLETLRQLRGILAGPLGPPIMAISAALQAGHAPGETQRFWDSRRSQIKPMFDAAVARGELPAGIDFELAFAQAAGPVYFRIYIMGETVDDDFLLAIVHDVCTLNGCAD